MRSAYPPFAVLAFCAACAAAPGKTVAITVDDLPYAAGGGDPADGVQAEAATHKLLDALRRRRVPVTAFVIGRRVEELGPSGPAILRQWLQSGFDLGNHTYSHPDIDALPVEEIESEIVRGEAAIAPLVEAAGKKLEFFRFPMNHTGDTAEKHEALAQFLKARGYRLATCTIDTSDYQFNQAYVRLLSKGDAEQAARLRREYLTYSAAEMDYYAGLDRQALGYQPPEVMLLHANRLNGDVMGQILDLFRARGYRFVSLTEAESDPAHRQPDSYVTKFGPMWGYRWAAERHVKVDGRLEPDPPRWIVDLAK